MPGCAPPKIDPALKAKAQALFLAGATCDYAASECGLNAGTIRVWATRHGWSAKKKEISNRIVARIADKVDAVANVAIGEHTKQVSSAIKCHIDRLGQLPLKKKHSITEIASAMKTFDDIARRNLGLEDTSGGRSDFHFHAGAEVPAFKTLDVTPEKLTP